jgi:hypothetical protein
VTNHHVAVYNGVGAPAPVIRINRRQGSPEIFDFDPAEWIFRPQWHDIAVSPPLPIDPEQHDAIGLEGNSWWLTEPQEAADEIGPLDDVFMVGRFIDYDGAETNAPAARLGHISVMHAPVEQPNGFRGRSIIVDVHSRSGFSGSPVFVYRTLGSHFIQGGPGTILTNVSHYVKLLGILWGQFPEQWELRNEEAKREASHSASLITKGQYVSGWSGMSTVIPSAYIADLVLNDPRLREMRAKQDAEIARTNPNLSSRPVAQSATAERASKPGAEANPDHREDFNRLVSAASKPKPKGGRT